ncbi:uncharacterized protein LOC116347803 [Contarinia nasturtii]|uniref:uncharacterized protein LOC116347803 n=1 Tax=Contarinia nasturtii TaxID=265458 RepID=UPI0012D41188|nr:uncharacterized protein LOC116347803 [Contarinia nasturtii]
MNLLATIFAISFYVAIAGAGNNVVDVLEYDPDPRISAKNLQANIWIEVKVKRVSVNGDEESIYVQLENKYDVQVGDVLLGFRSAKKVKGRNPVYKEGDKIWCNINILIPKDYDVGYNYVVVPKFEQPRVEDRMHLRRNYPKNIRHI